MDTSIAWTFLGAAMGLFALAVAIGRLRDFRKTSTSLKSEVETLPDGSLEVHLLVTRRIYRINARNLPRSPFVHTGIQSTRRQKLVLHSEEIDFGMTDMFGSNNQRPYSAVEQIEVSDANISIFFYGETYGFSTHLGNMPTLIEVLRYLHAKGCPMTQRAYDLLREADRNQATQT